MRPTIQDLSDRELAVKLDGYAQEIDAHETCEALAAKSILEAARRLRERNWPTRNDLMQDDLRQILGIVGLGNHARSASPHEVVQQELIPRLTEMVEAIHWVRGPE